MALEKNQILAGLGLLGVFGGIGFLAWLNSRRSVRSEIEGIGGEGERAARKFREVQWGQEPDGVVRIDERRRKIPKVLVDVGELDAVVYNSEKSGEPAKYIHFFSDKKPRLATTSDGDALFVVGGKTRVTGRGIEG